MTQDILRSLAVGAQPARDRLAPAAVQAAVVERLLLAVLPQGWTVIGRCRFGTALPGPYPTGCHALAHPEIGIALIDIAPDATPNAESRLRRALSAADFWSDVPGYLPIWHGRLEGPAIRALARIVQERFSTLPPLTVPGGQGWIDAVRQALAQDAAWEVPGLVGRQLAPLPLPPDPEETDEEPPRGRSRLRALLLLGFLGTFGLGLATGLLLLPQPEPSPPAMPLPPERAGLSVPLPTAGESAAEPLPADSAASEPALSSQAEPAAKEEPAEPGPDALDTAGIRPALPGSEEPATPTETANAPELPPVPPEPPPAPALQRTAGAPSRPARSVSGIDRACILALFRFQQGEALSAEERGYLHDGCTTRR